MAIAHVADAAAANHVFPATMVTPTIDGAGGAAAFAASLASPMLHQGAADASVPSAQHGSVVGALGSLTATAGTELGHTVNTLHAGISSEAHQTLEATPTSLEVGVHSGTQGWLKIRAEVGGEGQVSASLAATSSSGEQMLKGQLPALNAYLHSEQISLTASVAERIGIAHGVVAHDAGGTALQSGTGSANGQDASLLQSGTGHGGSTGGDRPQSDGTNAVKPHGESQVANAAVYVPHAEGSDPVPRSTSADPSGQWLNVTV